MPKAPKIKVDFLKKERDRNRAHDAAMGRTSTGRKKPVRKMSSTQKSLSDISKRANENYGKEYKHHVQGRKDTEADMKESIQEKLSVSDGMGAWIDDFKKSDAPQFKGKDSKERRDMAIAAYLSAKRGAKNEAKKVVITKKMQQRALSKVRAQPKDKVSLPKAPWDKKKKEEGYVSMAQQRAVWATRKDGGKGHPDNKKGKKK